MFSGIIGALEKPVDIKRLDKSLRVSLPIPKKWHLRIGESINIDGVCSTLTEVKDGIFSVFYMPETLKKTTFSELSLDHFCNLERPLRLNSLVGGHLVAGHVDTTGKVLSVKKMGEVKVLKIMIDKSFSKYLIYKGSVSVNGVSLTIVFCSEKSFEVSLIPYTLSHTNLGFLKKGDYVNIEVDLIAKYLEKM